MLYIIIYATYVNALCIYKNTLESTECYVKIYAVLSAYIIIYLLIIILLYTIPKKQFN